MSGYGADPTAAAGLHRPTMVGRTHVPDTRDGPRTPRLHGWTHGRTPTETWVDGRDVLTCLAGICADPRRAFTATFDNSGNKASSRGAAADLPQSLVVVVVV